MPGTDWIAMCSQALAEIPAMGPEESASEEALRRWLAALPSCRGEAASLLASALDLSLEAWPEIPSHGYGPIFQALAALDSDAGIPAALALIERIQRTENPVHFISALDYLRERPDSEVIPVIDQLMARKLFRRPGVFDVN